MGLDLKPQTNHYILHNASVPIGCWEGDSVDRKVVRSNGSTTLHHLGPEDTPVTVDHVATVDIEVHNDTIVGVYGVGVNGVDYMSTLPVWKRMRVEVLDAKGRMILPTFVDLHTHIGSCIDVRSPLCACMSTNVT